MVQALEERTPEFFPERAQAGLGTVLANSVAVGAVRQPELGLGAGHQVGIDSKAAKVAEQVRASGALAGLSGITNAPSPSMPDASWVNRTAPGSDTPGRGGRGGI